MRVLNLLRDLTALFFMYLGMLVICGFCIFLTLGYVEIIIHLVILPFTDMFPVLQEYHDWMEYGEGIRRLFQLIVLLSLVMAGVMTYGFWIGMRDERGLDDSNTVQFFQWIQGHDSSTLRKETDE